jgi:hypothetical protein
MWYRLKATNSIRVWILYGISVSHSTARLLVWFGTLEKYVISINIYQYEMEVDRGTSNFIPQQ